MERTARFACRLKGGTNLGFSLLIVIGSYRRLGNCEMFAKDLALRAGADSIALLRLTDFELKPCTGCYRCLHPEHRCRLQDDLYFILEQMKSFDGIVFSIPTYVLGPVGQFKLFADRLSAMAVFHDDFRNIRAVSAIFGGIESWRGVTQSLVNAVIRMMGFNFRGSAFVEAALPGESLDAKYRPAAQGLADALRGGLERYFPSDTLRCPSCGADLFFHRQRRLICALCGSSGERREDAWLQYEDSGRFTTKGFVEHFEGWLKPKVAEYAARREHHRALREVYKNIGTWIKKEG